jgi:hypothetical protein
MERVAFLLERSGERITCLLNPENLEARRSAGVRVRQGSSGFLTGVARSEDPLIATGGGVTEYDLHLLFDTQIAREGRPLPAVDPATGATLDPAADDDVRALTRPLWDLTENAVAADGFAAPPTVRLIWGKSWNIPGIVLHVAERLERFNPDGAPGRSWISLRLRRVEETEPRPAPARPVTPQFEAPSEIDGGAQRQFPALDVPVDDGLPLERLDQIAADRYGDPSLWAGLAIINDIDDPLNLPEGTTIVLPSLATVLEAMA